MEVIRLGREVVDLRYILGNEHTEFDMTDLIQGPVNVI